MNKQKKYILNVSRHLLLDTLYTEKQIAKILYISETTLRDLYNKNFNLPPKKYIRKVKIKKAQTLLRITNKSVSEIAYSIGYINTSKFSKAFKEQFGCTPSEYRKNCGFGVEKNKQKSYTECTKL